MKLKSREESPIGSWFYEDERFGKIGAGTFSKLVRAVEDRYIANGLQIENNLSAVIEDQICSRQPPGRCWYTKGLGDQISKVIHSVVGAVDKLAGTNLQTKARGCRGCGKRRMQLNSR